MDKTKLCITCIGRNIHRLRKLSNYSQFDLACLMNTDKSLISHLECGKANNVTIATLVKLSEIFCVSLQELIQDT